MRATVLFVVGAVSRRAAERGVVFTDADLDVLERIGESAGADVELLLACEAPATHGRKPTMKQVRAERDRLLAQVAASGASLVVAMGPIPVAALWGKGGMKASEMRMRRHDLPDVPKPVYVTWSPEEIAVGGLEQFAAIDVQRALAGELPTQWGEYHVQTEIHPELAEYLATAQLGEHVVSMDLETHPGLDPYAPDARIRMVVVSHRPGWAQVVQCGPASEVPDWVQDLLRDPSVLKTGSNIRFDVRWLRRFGYEVLNHFCTQHQEHVLDENCRAKDLKSLVLRYRPELGDYASGQHALVAERAIRDRKGKVVEDGWRFVRDEEMYQYAGGDGDGGIAVHLGQMRRIREEGLERPLAVMREWFPAISEVEMAGACVSLERNAELAELYGDELRRLRAEIRGVLGPINVGSPGQLIPALQAHCPGVDLRDLFARSKDGEDERYSTRAFVLRREAAKHPVLGLILEYRRRDALRRFVDGVRKYAVEVNGRHYVFSSLRGDVTATYRLSSSHPNLQNLPRTAREEAAAGLNVKRQYVSRFEGGSITEGDQSQLELRVAGMEAEDQALMQAFASGEDVHRVLAGMMRGVPLARVTDDMRQAGKTTNFHVLYGGGAIGLARRLGCDEWEARRLVQQFDETFIGYRHWEREQHRLARTRGWVESAFGFRRRIRRPESWTSSEGRHALRQAANAPIQGGASTIVNLGIVRVRALFRENGLRSVPFLTVHDSLEVDTFPGEEEVVRRLVAEGMEHPEVEKYGVELTIPLRVDFKRGPNWGEMMEVKG